MRSWKRLALIAAGVIALSLATISVRQANAAEYPQVSDIKPFSKEANFMSLPGYLRFLVHQQDDVWLSRKEAERIVKQQGGTHAQRPYDPRSSAGHFAQGMQ